MPLKLMRNTKSGITAWRERMRGDWIIDGNATPPPDVTYSQELPFRCSACGADRGCDCNAPAIEKAAAALARSPEKSDRAIAAEIGVSKDTVRRARTGADAPVDRPRVGLDGKTRKSPIKRTISNDETPSEEEADRSHQQALLYDQACLLLERMTDKTRRCFFAYIRRKYPVTYSAAAAP